MVHHAVLWDCLRAVRYGPCSSETGDPMRRTALLLLVLPLAACSGGSSTDAASSSTSSSPVTTSSSSAASSSSSAGAGAVQDPTVQKDCLVASLTYVPLKTALAGSDADLTSTLALASPSPLTGSGQTQQGKNTEVALAELNFEVTIGHGAASAGQTPDRAALLEAYSAAAAACAPFGASF